MYQIVCLVGTHGIMVTSLSPSGTLNRHWKKIDSPGRLLKIANDDIYNTGMLLMTDDADAASMDYRNVSNCSLYMFPLACEKKATVRLHALKQGTLYELLTSQQNPCLAHDSFFTVMQANRAVFMKEKDEFELDADSDEDEVKQAFADKELVTVVICTSGTNEASMMFTMTKDKAEDKTITNMRLIVNTDNTKSLEVDPDEDDTAPIHSFYITSEEFDENINSYV